jgi:hypothetical protein
MAEDEIQMMMGMGAVGSAEGDLLAASGAEEAPLGDAPAVHGVRAEEGAGELHATAEEAIKGGALPDDSDAGNLLDGTCEDCDGGGEEVGTGVVFFEPIG